MGAVFGCLSALAIGWSDLFARRAVRGSTALTVGVTMQTVAIAVSLVCVVGFGGTFGPRDMALGLASGIALGIGLGTYYGGIARSSATVVSPLVAVLSALIPFAYAVVDGASPTAAALGGAVVAVAGIVLITVGGGTATTHVRTGLAWGTLSGIAYGVGFAVVIGTTADAGAWPAVWQRVAGATVLAGAATRANVAVLLPASLRSTAAVGGVFAGLSTVFYLAGLRVDATATVITTSMFPAASVAVGRVFFHDRVSRLQAAGIAVVLVGVVGVAVG